MIKRLTIILLIGILCSNCREKEQQDPSCAPCLEEDLLYFNFCPYKRISEEGLIRWLNHYYHSYSEPGRSVLGWNEEKHAPILDSVEVSILNCDFVITTVNFFSKDEIGFFGEIRKNNLRVKFPEYPSTFYFVFEKCTLTAIGFDTNAVLPLADIEPEIKKMTTREFTKAIKDKESVISPALLKTLKAHRSIDFSR